MKLKKLRRIIIITYLNTDNAIDNESSLSNEQRTVFLEVIAESLRVSQRSHLFNWLQGGVQYLLGHELLICGIKSTDHDHYDYEYFTSTRYFADDHFNNVIKQNTGLINQALSIWKNTTLPIYVTHKIKAADFSNHSIVNFAEDDLKNSELFHFVAHGFGDSHSKISTFFVFARLTKTLNANQALILELLMPHLHCVLLRVTSNKGNNVLNINKATKKITDRESEVLQWVHMGKTNWEISTILNVSPLTVKNHVQNILRKLDVQNRGQAAVKAAKLGLVKLVR